MEAGIRGPGDADPDVFDHLAMKLRKNTDVREMVQRVADGELEKVCVGIGRESFE